MDWFLYDRDLRQKAIKNKKRSGTSPPASFSAKIFLLLFSVTWPNFTVWLPLLREILGNMYIVIVCYASCDVTNFEKFKYLEND